MTSLRANGSTTGADILIKRRDENGFLVNQILPNEEKQESLRLQKDEEEKKPVIDAGLKSLDHCTCDARLFFQFSHLFSALSMCWGFLSNATTSLPMGMRQM